MLLRPAASRLRCRQGEARTPSNKPGNLLDPINWTRNVGCQRPIDDRASGRIDNKLAAPASGGRPSTVDNYVCVDEERRCLRILAKAGRFSNGIFSAIKIDQRHDLPVDG